MTAETALQAELHPIEHELRRAPQVVVPRDERVADHDLALPPQPIGERAVVERLLGIDRDAGDADAAARVAAHRQLRPVDDQFAQAEVEQRQRRPGHDQVDARQLEQRAGRAGRAIANPQPADRQPRIPAVPPRRERVDLDGLPEPHRQHRGDVLAMGIDLRKDGEAHRQ